MTRECVEQCLKLLVELLYIRGELFVLGVEVGKFGYTRISVLL